MLSLLTGYASAQFHLKHDDFFEIVRDLNVLPKSQWQELARFTPEEMEGKLTKKGHAKDAIKGTKEKIQWEPDHTPIDDVMMSSLMRESCNRETKPAPHLPFNPLEEQREEGQEQADPFLHIECPPGTIT